MSIIKIENSWKQRLEDQFSAPHMTALSKFLRQEKLAGKKIYPPGGKIFNAFKLTKFSAVKVIILGQDPYHGPRQANGLSFSVERHIRIPPSLQNIFKELYSDLNIDSPDHGDLSAWAQQGVLLLNTCLTVEDSLPNSHQGKGWETFTDAVLSKINEERKHVVFILWGRKAQAKEKFILSITENGFGKKTLHTDYRVTNRGGKGIIGIINSPRNGNISSSFPVYNGDEILISTNKGRVIRVAVKEIRTAGRNTQGVRIIKLSGEEKVVSSIKIDDNLI